MERHGQTYRILLALATLAFAVAFTACQASEGPTVLQTAVLTWPAGEGRVAGQVIVTIVNEADHAVDPDVFGRGRQTVARLLDGGGDELPGTDGRLQLNAVPEVLGPGDDGYLFADFEVTEPPGGVADARIELNADGAEMPTPVMVEDFELVPGEDGLGARGRFEWNGSGSAVARAIALDEEGAALGYLTTSEVRYAPGEFAMCCFPPTVDADAIDDVAVFGVQAVSED
jgi:hypothetical protein